MRSHIIFTTEEYTAVKNTACDRVTGVQCVVYYLQSCEVPRQLLDNRLQGTSVGLGVTNKAEVKQEGVSAVLFMFDAHGTPN